MDLRKVKSLIDLVSESDISELERINEQISHYKSLLKDMKSEMSSTDVTRTIMRSGNQ